SCSRRAATRSYGVVCSSLALSAFSSSGSKRAGAVEILEGEETRQIVEARLRLDGIRGADQRRIAGERQRLEAVLAQALNGQRAEPLRQRLAVGADEQAVVAEGRRIVLQGLEQLQL